MNATVPLTGEAEQIDWKEVANQKLISDLATRYNWHSKEDPGYYRVARRGSGFSGEVESSVPNDDTNFSFAKEAGLTTRLDASHCRIKDSNLLEAVEVQRLLVDYKWERTDEPDVYKVSRRNISLTDIQFSPVQKGPEYAYRLRDEDKARIGKDHKFAEMRENGNFLILNEQLKSAIESHNIGNGKK